jgi:hypothetical protein
MPFTPDFYRSWDEVPEAMRAEFEYSPYWAMRIIPGHGLCALQVSLFTVDLLLKIGPTGYYGRYTFETLLDACSAICTWSGEGRPGTSWIGLYGGEEGRVRNMAHPINKGRIEG